MTTPRPLRIGIATSGRFHVLDLARELDALGYHVRFYSYVPKRRATRFGLPARCHVALLPYLLPLFALARLCRRTRWATPTRSLLQRAADWLVARRLQRCDVFIGMSGMYNRAAVAARQKFSAKIVIERGSTHIQTQKAILDGIKALNPCAATVPVGDVRRELESYAIADLVVVPSRHAEASFLEHGFPPERLFRNPYGVDLSMFTPDFAVARDPKLILFVGGWVYRKGADVLSSAMHELAGAGFRLCHIGSVGDAPVPQAPWFEATGPLDQTKLPAWYRRAHCLVLPSREEGLSLVQIQALACGCPIIGTTMTGAADLAEMVPDAGMVQVVAVGDGVALAAAVRQLPTRAQTSAADTGALRSKLSWRAYAQRYAATLQRLTQQPT